VTSGRRVTAKDVALHAGVSASTVSYVINNTPNQTIPDATRTRVLDAVQHLGYRPSAAARALRSGTSRTVLLVLPDAPIGPSIAQLIDSLTDALDPHGYTVVYRRHRRGQDLDRLWHELLPAALVDVMVLGPGEEHGLAAAGIPVVAVRGDDEGPGTIGSAQTAIGRRQVEHLRSRGHHRLGYASLPDERVRMFHEPRLAGVRLECAGAGLPDPVVLPVPPQIEAAVEAVSAWRSGPDPVTAVCAFNDEVAFTLLAAMARLGLRAPDDLALIGVDNQFLSPFSIPPLTSVDIHVDHLAAELAEALLERLLPGHVRQRPAGPVVPTLVVRETS
jgi:DNA-binding LacI/PurR family transcriptional regulator